MDQSYTIKTDVQNNGEILLFYVDENGANEEGVLTTIQNIEEGQLDQLSQNFIIEETEVSNEDELTVAVKQGVIKERWLDVENRRLLIFYIDNKDNFQNGITRKKHLWTVACKTMLTGKHPHACEIKLRNMKRKYALLRMDQIKNKSNDHKRWAYYDLCHQAFHDDSFVKTMIDENSKDQVNTSSIQPDEIVRTSTKKSRSGDKKVEQMLTSYLVHKRRSPKDHLWQKNFWLKIAIELGEDADYWHKRFLNFKQHYIRMTEKRKESGEESIYWPYMSIFDDIFGDDDEFQQRYGTKQEKDQNIHSITSINVQVNTSVPVFDWNDTEKTVLVKYFFDCYDEFQDRTIPNSVLWNEVGRLLDKNPDDCKQKYQDLHDDHIHLYLNGGYDLRARKPISILFDNIISKETEQQLSKNIINSETWETENIDILVNFFYDNIEIFKDAVCHFVCYAAIAKKLSTSVQNCRRQWEDLVTLYKSILEYKKEDSDLQIDWRYIEIFDRVFDYGMDTKLLDGYEKPVAEVVSKKGQKAGLAKKATENMEDLSDNVSDDEDYDPDKASSKRARGTGDPKQIKILEYYMKNKDKFSTTQRKKQFLWDVLAKQIGISAEQCAHRFRNLKQVYVAYIQREIDKPEKPILWPYYALCKKVFGYRAIKNKLKTGKLDSDDSEDWAPKEIKQIINYFANHFQSITNNTDDASNWTSLAEDMGKSQTACKDKFLDLRKSYRKIKTMITKNPECKVNWKYFKMFEEIYSTKETGEHMQVDQSVSFDQIAANIKTELQEDEDFQCIIVIPEGEELTDISNAQIIIKDNQDAKIDERRKLPLWKMKTKKQLVKHVYDYVKNQQGKLIDTKEMWKEIGSKFPESTPRACKNMYIRLKNRYKEQDPGSRQKYQYTPLLKKILALKPKYVRPPYNDEEVILKERTTYTDISLPLWKVEKALQYYSEHLEEFLHPKYDHKYAWIELGKLASLNAPKLFRKINYLKQFFNSETDEVNGEKFEFADSLKNILQKEFILKIAIANEPKPITDEEESGVPWTDEEVEQLLLWYLENLEKFKNPKFVPSYLWMEASSVLNKSAVTCSKKMTEIRSQYSTMVKENSDALSNWKFHELCQKIYGTGKKSSQTNGD